MPNDDHSDTAPANKAPDPNEALGPTEASDPTDAPAPHPGDGSGDEPGDSDFSGDSGVSGDEAFDPHQVDETTGVAPDVFPAPTADTVETPQTTSEALDDAPPPTEPQGAAPLPPPPGAPGTPGAVPPPPVPPPVPPTAGPAPGQPWGQPGPRRLTRSRDRKLGGVAGGIADYLGIDPTLVRLGFLLAIFIGGAGVIAYLVAWIVLPEGDGNSPDGAGRPPMRVRRDGTGVDTTTALAIGLLVFAVLFGVFGLTSPGGGKVLVPIAMIAGGIWLLSQREPARSGDDSTVAYSSAGVATSAPAGTAAFQADDTTRFDRRWEHPAADPMWTGTDPTWTETQPAPTPATPPEPRRPAVVTRITLSLLALLAAGAIAADELDLFDVTVPGVLAVALVIVGLGAITAAFIGRGRGLIPVGLLLALAFAGAATVQPLVDDGTGQRTYAPTSVADVEDRYELGIGDLEVDLSGLDIAPGSTVETTVDLGIGSAEVLVPAAVDVIVDGEVGMGELRVFELIENGFGNELRRTRTVEVSDGSGTPTTIDDVDGAEEPGTLVIRLEVGIGEGVVGSG
jgi:phage shock protein PspC (stress-responsive transcriptional regulator)